ncbi:MAG: M12 family metallo-peptidase [Chromatiales bacterium]|nr:M12 family metallo-peptidase [Chromatiales bacterium]
MSKNSTRSKQIGLTASVLSALYLAAPAQAAESEDGLWSDLSAATKAAAAEQEIKPLKYRLLSLDKNQFDSLVAKAPMEGASAKAPTIFSLPLPDGGFERFEVIETQLMHPDLAAKFPGTKTYKGIGYDNPAAWIRFDWTSTGGFHGFAKTSKGTVYVDPYTKNSKTQYMSYFRKHFMRPFKDMQVETPPQKLDDGYQVPQTKATIKSSGSQLRTYRLAVAATGEYTAYFGGTTGAHNAIVSAINRVTGIYENDIAVSFQLIGNNDSLIHTNSSTDPYSNYDGVAMLSQNQNHITSTIGSSNYDVGHVFSTGGGGIASLRVPCKDSYKARGVTGSYSPTNDPFWVDYVAHELGHQFGGNHTFNGTQSSCGGGNRNSGTAYEPGSGSTIMAYAGICGSDDVQNSSDTADGISDDYFHVESIDEMVAYTTTDFGNTCGTVTATGNTPPTANAGAGGFYIPHSTPFVLTGTATDPNGTASLTYTWEQYDLGPAGSGSPSASSLGPLFRSREGTTNTKRYFPQMADILSGANGNSWEVLPSISRELNFKLTVRDKDNSQVGTGGVDSDLLTFNVDGNSGPFRVTSQNNSTSYQAGDSVNVTWNVAGTNTAPVSCPSVDIQLTTDGGQTFSTLAASTPNDGTQSVTIPSIETSTARIVVGCSNNIFFDIADSNFSITVPAVYNCSGTTPTVSNKTFMSGEVVTCTGSTSVNTSGNVTVSSGATVKFVAPTVNINAGFNAASGSSFNACTSAPCP